MIINEEWEDEAKDIKYPFRSSASMMLTGSDSSFPLSKDVIIDAVVTYPANANEIGLEYVEVFDKTVRFVLFTNGERLEALATLGVTSAPIRGQASGSVFGCLVFSESIGSICNMPSDVYRSDLTNKFVPKVFKTSSPAGLSSISAQGQTLTGDIYLTLGKGVSYDKITKVLSIQGNPYLERNTLYEGLAPSQKIGRPILRVNGVNEHNTATLSILDAGDPTKHRYEILPIPSDTLEVRDVRDVQ